MDIRNEKIKEIVLYIIIGGLTTVISMVTFYFFVEYLNINYMISNILSWFIAVVFAYITNKLFVFKNSNFEKKYLLKEVNSFVVSRIASLVIEMILLFLLIDIFSYPTLFSKLLISVVVVVLNYILSKFFIFKN